MSSEYKISRNNPRRSVLKRSNLRQQQRKYLGHHLTLFWMSWAIMFRTLGVQEAQAFGAAAFGAHT